MTEDEPIFLTFIALTFQALLGWLGHRRATSRAHLV